MSLRFAGPWPFDLQAPVQSAQKMLAAHVAAVQGEPLLGTPGESEGVEAGAYLVLDGDALVGFWLVFSRQYLDDGATGGVVPPYVDAFFEAATEEIWWTRFPVGPRVGDRWTPLVVLEWPAELASRSTMAPPGVPLEVEPEEVSEPDADGGGSWLRPEGSTVEVSASQAVVDSEWVDLPAERSLLAVVRGDMRRLGSLHEGSYELVFPAASETAYSRGEPLDAWFARAQLAPSGLPEAHRLGSPVALPGDRAGFPVPGWLDRELDLAPAAPGDAVVGHISPRDVRNRLWSQLALTSAILMGVLLVVIVVEGSVYLAALPRTEMAPELPEAEPQPALSVCSEDYMGFVEELRCQVHALAEGQPLDEEGCAQGVAHISEQDLLPAYCGLRDRDRDGNLSRDRDRWADLAAAQACSNVLGHPASHAQEGFPFLADPAVFLVEGDGYVPQLQSLVERLDKACEVYHAWIQDRVGGAILAAHVGGSDDEARALGELALERAMHGLPDQSRECFQRGFGTGAGDEVQLEQLCGDEVTLRAALASELGVLEALEVEELVADVLGPTDSAAVESKGAIPRYMLARYSHHVVPEAVGDDLLRCHVRLGEAGSARRIEAEWGLVASPKVGSQLVLDAVLTKLRAGRRGEVTCWDVVEGQLAAYEPVHPLLSTPDAAQWPSVEQQLCGQVCESYYRLDEPGRYDDWVTRGTDVRACVDLERPPADSEIMTAAAASGMDRLHLPWSQATTGEWVEPSVADVCAFNLVAQGRLPGVLPEGLPPPIWAGEVPPGLAGGYRDQGTGASYQSAVALNSYGRARTARTCAIVAAQCFASRLLDVLDPDLGYQRYEWDMHWRAAIDPNRSQGFSRSPWCGLLRPHIRGEDVIQEGEFDFPCTFGIHDSRARFESAIHQLVSSPGAGGTP